MGIRAAFPSLILERQLSAPSQWLTGISTEILAMEWALGGCGGGRSATVGMVEGWGRRKSVSASPGGHGFWAAGHRGPTVVGTGRAVWKERAEAEPSPAEGCY